MLSISNANVLDYCKGGANTLSAAVAFSYNSGAGTITFTDNTTYASGDSREIVQISVFDRFGNKKELNIAANATGNAVTLALSSSGLNKTEGLDVIATVISAKGMRKDGSIQDLTTLKTTGNFYMEH